MFKCPFLCRAHQSENGCSIIENYNSEGGKIRNAHKFNCTRISSDENGIPLYKKLSLTNTSVKMDLNYGTGEVLTVYNPICALPFIQSIKTPKQLLEIISKLLTFYDCVYETLGVYPTLKSMSDVIIEHHETEPVIKFLRFVHFTTDKRLYYRNVYELFESMYTFFIDKLGNEKKIEYNVLFDRAHRNIVQCNLERHKKAHLLQNSYKCSPTCTQSKISVCIHGKNKSIKSSDGQINHDEWCYEMITKEKQYQLQEILEFKCLLSTKTPQSMLVNYLLFSRSNKNHILLCCPKRLIDASWYSLFKDFINENLQKYDSRLAIYPIHE